MGFVAGLGAAVLRVVLLGALLAAGLGCASATIEPGHRGLLFDARRGLQRASLPPGYYRLSSSSRIEDFDVTYTSKLEPLHALVAEGLVVDAKITVIFRPIVAELYELDSEIGPRYYDEVVGPELRSAARGAFARHSMRDMMSPKQAALEDEIEADVRRRLAGKHVELASVVIERLDLAPEVVAAIRARLVQDEEASRHKAERDREKLEADAKWEKEKTELEHEVTRRRLQREAAGVPAATP